MTKPLDELYLNWLYALVADPDERAPHRTYWKLLRMIFRTEFVWFIPNDDNRAADGRELRYEFIESQELDVEDPEWWQQGCSMLELLIGLSRRLSFLAEGEPSGWFWHLVTNLGIRCNDRGQFPNDLVEEVLNNVIWRTYQPNGFGGLFPLRHADRDQREVELWYQLNEYLLERV